jgi:uncharacterized phiE125 gp8 family phage protein
MTTTYSLNRTVGPASEPVTLAECKDHLELAASDTTHETKLQRFLEAARERVESDTNYAMISQTYTLSLDEFPKTDIEIPIRPLSSVSSITYYDEDNAQQTLSTDVYAVDLSRRIVHLKYDKEWPETVETRNAVTVTFHAGYGSASAVPRLFKQLILLQVALSFEDRGDLTKRTHWETAYERLLPPVKRSSYP